MVIAPEGLIIIDTTESMVAARQIKDEFRKYSTAPIKAIIYTHHHADHIGGAKVMYSYNNKQCKILDVSIRLLSFLHRLQC